uniref:Rz-like protein n=4 Tax=unclassified bacterial viruses TaxID=12333 RepID=A0AAU6W0H5_9VIRU
MKTILLLLGLCVALAASTGYYAVQTSNARGALADAQSELTAAKKRIATVQAQVLRSNAAAQKARADLKDALDAEPTFRDTPVPVPVRDSLCGTLRCK